MIKNLFANWRTTSAGLVMLITGWVRFAFALKAHTATENEWTSVLITTVGGVGLILAGDAGSSATKVETDAIKNAVVTGDTSMLRKTDIKP